MSLKEKAPPKTITIYVKKKVLAHWSKIGIQQEHYLQKEKNSPSKSRMAMKFKTRHGSIFVKKTSLMGGLLC